MTTRIRWTCPSCHRDFAVPSADGLTLCPDCRAATSASLPIPLDDTEVHRPSISRKKQASTFEFMIGFGFTSICFIGALIALYRNPQWVSAFQEFAHNQTSSERTPQVQSPQETAIVILPRVAEVESPRLRPEPVEPPRINAVKEPVAAIKPPPKVEFFGLSDRAKRIVFLVDSSSSMNEYAAFDAAKSQLAKVMDGLDAEQEFLIIFFEDRAKVVKLGDEAKAVLYQATPENKALAKEKCASIEASDASANPAIALALALTAQPDVIFYVTNQSHGALNQEIVSEFSRVNAEHGQVTVHAVELGTDSEQLGDFTDNLSRIASLNNGKRKYHRLPVPPENERLDIPKHAVSRDRLSAWTEPEQPEPGKMYELVVLLHGIKTKTYNSSDLSGMITGSDKYKQAIGFSKNEQFSVKDGVVRVRIQIPGAGAFVRDTIRVESKMLGSSVTIDPKTPSSGR